MLDVSAKILQLSVKEAIGGVSCHSQMPDPGHLRGYIYQVRCPSSMDRRDFLCKQ